MRYHYIVSYDIADPTRLRKVFNLCRGHGDHLQDSVFACQLSEMDHAILKEKLYDLINHKQDMVMIIKICPVSGKGDKNIEKRLTTLGCQYTPRDLKRMIY